MNTKKILTSLLATVLLAGAMTVSAWAADATVTTEAELKAALEGAVEGDVITVDGLVELTEDITIGNGITLVGNDLKGSIYAANDASVTVNIPSATLIASGDITFVGESIVNSFNPYWYNNTITIGKNASLSVVGTGRMTVGYGNVFVIEGNISNAKTTNKEDVVPSLSIPAGISINGSSGASFIAKDAYVSFGLTQSKNYGASGDFEISFENCIVDFSNNLTFSTSTQGATPKFDVEFVDSIMNFEKNLDFANEACNVLVDNSVVTIGSSFRNDGKLDIVNGSEFTVEYQIQPGEHGGHSGTITVDDSEFTIECTSTGHAFDGLGTGVIIAKNGATVDVDYVKDASVLKYGDSTVITQNDGLIGESEVIADPVAEVDGTYYSDLQTALKAMTEGSVLTLLDDVTVDYYWDCRFTGSKFTVPVTIDGNGHKLTFTETVYDGGNHLSAFRFENTATVKNLTIDMSKAKSGFGGRFRAVSAKADLTVDNCTFIGNGSANNTRAIIFGEGAGTAVSEIDVEITNSEFIGWRRGVSDNENAQDAKTVVIDECKFEDASVAVSATDEVTFTDNTIDDGYLTIYANGNVTDLVVTVTGNELDDTADNKITDGKIITDEENIALPKVFINANGYDTIEAAIAAASEYDTITIAAGTYDAFTVPADKNNLTFVGETDADGNNLVSIRTLEDDIATQTKGIYVQAEKATFKNLNIVSGSALVKWLCSALGATNNSVGLGHSNLNDLTIENCNFKGNGSKYAVWTRACDVTIINTTIDGYTYGIESYNLGADQRINITGSEISNTGNAIHTVNTVDGSMVTVDDCDISAKQIHSSGEGDMNITNSTLTGVEVVSYKTLSINIADSALYSCTIGTYDNNSSVSLERIFADNVNDIVESVKAYNVDFKTYYATIDDYNAKINLKEVLIPTDAIYVKFEKVDIKDGVDTDEQADLYNINLVADAETINRLNSVDLTFVLTQKTGNNEFEIIASNDEIVINPVNNSTDRYEFHYDGKDGVKTDTGALITIGQVKFTGYGIYSFAVDATATTNAAHATTIGDNIVDTFVPNGDTATVADGELVIDDKTITEILIAVPTRNLVINIDFPNAVKTDNNFKYQDMKVVVSGGELAEAIVVDLGAEAVMPTLTTDVKTTAKVEAAASDKYVVTLTDVLEVNNAYTVEVSGAGYRTAKYTVTMTEDKTLNFWNNVKDNETAIEEGKKTAKVTYLAGDIVKDGTINVYDLSAVVSYFGEIDLNVAGTQNAYAKYDLNRDGKIDSKDVAYVLVSWGK